MSEIKKIEGFEQAQEYEPTTQVYKATHKGDGSRLPFMSRSFISFSYGGKLIEDFGFIVSIDGDRMERGLYANFQDNVSETEVLDQRFFWSTHLSGTDLELTLSTDGITDQQLDEFKKWFCPGKSRELILSEHPNRAIMARIGSVPQMHFLPFEKKSTVKISGLTYKTSTTLYRGDVNITFTMDDPLWYSISNLLYCKTGDEKIDYDNWLSAQGIITSIYRDPDAIKIILEDGISTNGMLKYDNMLTGNDIIIEAETLPNTQIGPIETGTDTEGGARAGTGQIGPLFTSTNGIDVPASVKDALYFYYGGTAPSKPILQFTLTPTIDEEGYINSPMNSFIDNDSPYNTIVFESKTKKEFRFTTPSIWTGYNQAIAILKKMDDQPLIDVRRALREGVNHWAPRAYAIARACVENGKQQLDSSAAIDSMKNFLKNEDNEIASGSFKIDNKTGRSIGNFICRDSNNNQIEVEEEIGDMIRSNYLIIEDRNYPSPSGYIECWTEENPEYSHRVYHDVEGGLTNVLIKYKNMYY